MLECERTLALKSAPPRPRNEWPPDASAPPPEPAQERSRVTYDAIVAATARVLVKDGYDALSTNRVSREAGVSVGSLYQYFPGKEALVAAVMEQHAARLQAHIEERLMNVGASGPLEVATEMIRAMLEAQRKEPRLHRALAEQVPRIGALRRLHEIYGRYERLIAAWMEANRDHVEVKDVEIAAFVLVAAVEGLVNRVLLDRPELVSSGKIEEHILRLALAYVAPSLVSRISAEGGLAGKPPSSASPSPAADALSVVVVVVRPVDVAVLLLLGGGVAHLAHRHLEVERASRERVVQVHKHRLRPDLLDHEGHARPADRARCTALRPRAARLRTPGAGPPAGLPGRSRRNPPPPAPPPPCSRRPRALPSPSPGRERCRRPPG